MKELNEQSKVSLANKEKIEKVLSFIVIKKLIKPISKTDAFKLGLVDKTGKLIKDPETDEEKQAFSVFDKIIFKIKRLLGSRISQLNTFIYLQSIDDDFLNNIVVTGSLSKRAAVNRMTRDIESVKLEKCIYCRTPLIESDRNMKDFYCSDDCKKETTHLIIEYYITLKSDLGTGS
jgi:hypothetical protein